jgi:Transposase DDE domain
MPTVPPAGQTGLDRPGGIGHQMVLWLNQVGVLQPLLEQLHLREIVREALQQVQGEEATVVGSGRLVEVLVRNRLMAPRPLYRVGEWLAGSVLAHRVLAHRVLAHRVLAHRVLAHRVLAHRVLAHRLRLDPDQANDARLGRLLDALDGVTDTLWPQLVAHALGLGGADLAAGYYDITSFYFAGDYADVPEITYGYSRDGRPDTQQLELGLTVTAPDGLPLAYRVLAGNTADARTPVDNLQLVHTVVAQVAPDIPFPLVISDRAMLSLATLATLAAYEAAGVRYLGPLPDSALTAALLEQAASTDWAAHALTYRPARDQRGRPSGTAAGRGGPEEEGGYFGRRLSVALPLPAVGTTPARTVTRPALGVKSTRKASLDATHRETLLARLETALTELAGKLNRGRYRRRAAVEARLATLLAAPGTARVRRFLSVTLAGTDGHLTLTVERAAAMLAHAARHDGRYVLVPNDDGVDDEQLLARTKGRDRVEKRIGIFKGSLAVRPLFLEKVERIRALVFMCLVALLVYSLLQQRARQAGLPLTGRKVLERFAVLQSAVCSAVLTTFVDGTMVLLAVPFSARQQEVAQALALPDPHHWLVPLDPLPNPGE